MAIAVLVIAFGLQAQPETQKSSALHLGTWQLASFKYGTNSPKFIDFPTSHRRIKLITETHFTWSQFATNNGKILTMGGGSYSLTGNTYTESIDFGLGMDRYISEKHLFTIRIDGDKFFLSGSLADGLKIEEVWQRMK